jgi:hypothetical protein
MRKTTTTKVFFSHYSRKVLAVLISLFILVGFGISYFKYRQRKTENADFKDTYTTVNNLFEYSFRYPKNYDFGYDIDRNGIKVPVINRMVDGKLSERESEMQIVSGDNVRWTMTFETPYTILKSNLSVSSCQNSKTNSGLLFYICREENLYRFSIISNQSTEDGVVVVFPAKLEIPEWYTSQPPVGFVLNVTAQDLKEALAIVDTFETTKNLTINHYLNSKTIMENYFDCSIYHEINMESKDEVKAYACDNGIKLKIKLGNINTNKEPDEFSSYCSIETPSFLGGYLYSSACPYTNWEDLQSGKTPLGNCDNSIDYCKVWEKRIDYINKHPNEDKSSIPISQIIEEVKNSK